MKQPIQEINYTISDERDWTVGYAYKGYGYVIKRPNGGVVCNVAEGLRPEEAALARLLSATPDLLAAAKFAADALLCGRTANANADAYSKLVEAIAKATGSETM